MDLRRLDAFALNHFGLVNWEAAHAQGVSRSAWYRYAASGLVERLYPGVVRLHGAPVTREQRILAAVWASGPGAMASHRSAAFLWGVSRPDDDPIDVILPSRSRHALPDGVVIHRPRDLKDLRAVVLRGIPTTTPMRMLVDLGAVDAAAVDGALESVLSRRLASPAVIRRSLARHSKRGRHGSVALRASLNRWLEAELPPDSELEIRMAELARDHRLPALDFHTSAAGFEVDFLVRGSKVVIECDGWGVHGLQRSQFEFDRLRDAELSAAGYIVVHVTWRQIVEEPAKVAARILQVVRRWAPHVLA
jgi:very-short-patch-repair endonuclease